MSCSAHRLRLDDGEAEEVRRQRGAHLLDRVAVGPRPAADEVGLREVLRAASGVVASRLADSARPTLSRRRCGSKLEELHAAVARARGLLLDTDDRVAVAHPGAAVAGEAELVELAEHLELPRVLPSGGATNSPSRNIAIASSSAGRAEPDTEARRGHAGGAHHDQLAATRQVAEAEQCADQCARPAAAGRGSSAG